MAQNPMGGRGGIRPSSVNTKPRRSPPAIAGKNKVGPAVQQIAGNLMPQQGFVSSVPTNPMMSRGGVGFPQGGTGLTPDVWSAMTQQSPFRMNQGMTPLGLAPLVEPAGQNLQRNLPDIQRPGAPSQITAPALQNFAGGAVPNMPGINQAAASIMPYGMGTVTPPMAGNQGLMGEQARMMQVDQQANQRLADINSRQQFLDARYAAQGMNQRAPAASNYNAMSAGAAFNQQQMGALGYQQGAGINPALAAQSNFRTDFASMPGGANMLARFGNTGAMNPMADPGTVPSRNPQEVLGEMRTRSLQAAGGRNYKGGYVNSKGAFTDRSSFFEELAGQATDPQERANYMAEAQAAREGARAAWVRQEERQQAYRDARGGMSEKQIRQQKQQISNQKRWLKQQGIDPRSGTAAAFAPDVYSAVKERMSNRRGGGAEAANPMTDVFSPKAPRTQDNIAVAKEFGEAMFFGKTDAEGKQIIAAKPLFASMGFNDPEEVTMDSFNDKLAEQAASGIEWSDEDLTDIHRFAMSRRLVEGPEALSNQGGFMSRVFGPARSVSPYFGLGKDVKQLATGIGPSAARNMWGELETLGEAPSPDKLRAWADRYKAHLASGLPLQGNPMLGSGRLFERNTLP